MAYRVVSTEAGFSMTSRSETEELALKTARRWRSKSKPFAIIDDVTSTSIEEDELERRIKSGGM